jgi:hypothetical protein
VHGEAGASLIQLEALLSLGLGPEDDPARWQFTGALRRGDLDLVLPPASTSTFQEMPRWDDYHAQLRSPLLGGELRALVFGSQDSMVVEGGPVNGSTTSSESSSFTTEGLAWTAHREGWLLQASAWAGQNRQYVDLGPNETLQEDPYTLGGRAEAGVGVAEDHSFDFGAEYQETRTLMSGVFARLPAELGTDISFSALTNTAVDAWGEPGSRTAGRSCPGPP